MSNQQTLETVLQGYVVAVAAQNMWLRKAITQDIKDVNQFKQMVENAIVQDIASAKEQLPNFLKDLEVPAELETKLREIHISSFFAALEADAEIGLRNLSAHFGLARTATATTTPVLTVMDGGKAENKETVVETPPADIQAPPPPPAPPAPPAEQQ